MNEQQRYLLISNKKQIAEDLMVQHVFSYLQSKFVLSIDDVEIIKNEETSRKKAGRLISILLKKKKNIFNHFHDALKHEEYHHLAALLESGLTDNLTLDSSDSETEDLPDIDKILLDGGVPKLPEVYLNRSEDALRLKNALEELREGDGWVILHGMGGTGKTLLAAESLNNEVLVYSCFPGGIFWLNIGFLDNSRLLMKMQNLCSWLDQERTYQIPTNLEEARDRLRILFSQEHPRSLLVLDDVWSEEVIKYFDIRVRILVTTRYSGVADKVLGKVLKVPITEKLSSIDSFSLLKRWTGLETLPEAATKIIDYTKGFPLALSMLGALLNLHPKRWTYYAEQLEKQSISRIKSKIAYEYSSLYDAIAVSVDHLENKLKGYYLRLAVFDEDISMNAKTLAVFFQEDEIEIEDAMIELSKYSLITIMPNNEYKLHSINLAYLKEKASANGVLKEYHRELVNSYELLGEFNKLGNDGYVYSFLVSHMLYASMVEEAVSLMLDLNWLEKMLVFALPNTVIKTLGDIAEIVVNYSNPKVQTQVLNDLSRLIIVQLHVLPPLVQEIDLSQMMLSNGSSKELYYLARHHIEKQLKTHPELLFYEWVNKPNEMETELLLTKKAHEGDVNCCRFGYCDSDKVLTCGVDKLIKVWHSETGEELQVFDGHTDSVNCCVFSIDNKFIISCSSDGTVKIWSVETGSEKLTIKSNQDEILWCDLSSDGCFIVTASIDSSVKLWFMENGFLYHTFSEHTDVVNCCCFSPDSQFVASCSNDLFIKLYNIESKSVIHTFGGDKDFVSCCLFSPDGKLLVGCSLNFITFYSTTERKEMWCIATPCNVLSIQYCHQQRYLVVANCDMKARLLDVEKRMFIQSFAGHSSWINDASISPDNCSILTACADGMCKRWAIQPSKFEIEKLTNVFDTCLIDGKQIIMVAATNNKTFKVFVNEVLINESAEHESNIACCMFTVDGAFFIIAQENGSVHMIDRKSHSLCWRKHVHTSKVCQLSVTSEKLASFCEDRITVIWRLVDGDVLFQLQPHQAMITSITFHHNENILLTTSYDGTLVAYDSTSGTEVFVCDHASEAVLSCVVSHDGNFVATCTAIGQIILWNGVDGKHVMTIDGHDDACRSLGFSNDNQLLASGSDDGSAKIWEISTRESLCECTGHESWITHVQFNDQRTLLVTLSNNIKWFNMKGLLMQTYRPVSTSIRTLKLTPDFDTVVTVDDLGYFYLLKRITAN